MLFLCVWYLFDSITRLKMTLEIFKDRLLF